MKKSYLWIVILLVVVIVVGAVALIVRNKKAVDLAPSDNCPRNVRHVMPQTDIEDLGRRQREAIYKQISEYYCNNIMGCTNTPCKLNIESGFSSLPNEDDKTVTLYFSCGCS
jgi:hypothetical protein